VPVLCSFQDSSGYTSSEEAGPRQRADVQLPVDIELIDSFEGDRTAGVGQAQTSPAPLFELRAPTVGLAARALH